MQQQLGHFKGSLLTSLLMNVFYLRRREEPRKYFSAFAVTLGIILCTLATADLEKVRETDPGAKLFRIQSDASLSLNEAEKHFKEWAIGIAMLITALVLSSYMAICQERMYTGYGKHPREAMFYIASSSF